MKFSAKIDLDKTRAKLLAIGSVLQKPMRELLTREARLAAVSCAKSTQPYGTGDNARSAGLNRTAADIYHVYTTPGKAFADIQNAKQAKAFWSALQHGQLARAQAILNAFGQSLKNVPLQRFDGGTLHRQARDRETGRVDLKKPLAIVTNTPQLRTYIEQEQGKEGFAKSAWASLARDLGGTRGIASGGEDHISAAWITRNRAPGKLEWSGSDESPIITLTSLVNYAAQVLPEEDRAAAVRIARERLLKSLEYALRAELKTASLAA